MKSKKKKRTVGSMPPYPLFFPDIHVWNTGTSATGVKDCWSCPLNKFLYLVSWLWSRDGEMLCTTPYTGQTLKQFELCGSSPIPSTLKNKWYFKNLTCLIQFQRLACRKPLNLLGFIFLQSNASFLVFCLLSLVSVFPVDSSVTLLHIIKFL